MTHDELRDYIDKFDAAGMVNEPTVKAIRAVVELHKPIETYNMNNVHKAWFTCTHCNDEVYPCPTIQAIEKELG
jgi:hypothetical protein